MSIAATPASAPKKTGFDQKWMVALAVTFGTLMGAIDASIVNVAEGRDAVLAALQHLPPHAEPSLHFGVGNSARLFMDRLRDSAMWTTSRQKQFQDVEMSSAGGPKR